MVYFVASNLVRARATADIFLQIAKDKVFEILVARESAPNKVDPNIKAELGGDQMRTLDSWSLNMGNMLV